MKKAIFFAIVTAAAIFIISGCGSDGNTNDSGAGSESKSLNVWSEPTYTANGEHQNVYWAGKVDQNYNIAYSLVFGLIPIKGTPIIEDGTPAYNWNEECYKIGTAAVSLKDLDGQQRKSSFIIPSGLPEGSYKWIARLTYKNNAGKMEAMAWDYSDEFVISAPSGTAGGTNSQPNLQSAPTATTGEAMTSDPESATVKAEVNPNGLETAVWFEYGTDPNNLNIQSESQSIPEGNEAVSVSITLFNLASGTDYMYRAVAQNSKGTDVGETLYFSTGIPPTTN